MLCYSVNKWSQDPSHSRTDVRNSKHCPSVHCWEHLSRNEIYHVESTGCSKFTQKHTDISPGCSQRSSRVVQKTGYSSDHETQDYRVLPSQSIGHHSSNSIRNNLSTRTQIPIHIDGSLQFAKREVDAVVDNVHSEPDERDYDQWLTEALVLEQFDNSMVSFSSFFFCSLDSFSFQWILKHRLPVHLSNARVDLLRLHEFLHRY